jgi:hypothetical protein
MNLVSARSIVVPTTVVGGALVTPVATTDKSLGLELRGYLIMNSSETTFL